MKRFTLPVAHVDYSVIFVNKLVHKGNRCAGLCDLLNRVITIENNPNTDIMRQAIWHEFEHAFVYETGRHISMDEEANADGRATAIMRVRLEQPWL